MSHSLRHHGLWTDSFLCPWDFPGKNTGVDCHFLLQGIFPTQGLNPSLLHLLHWQVDSLPLAIPGKLHCQRRSHIWAQGHWSHFLDFEVTDDSHFEHRSSFHEEAIKGARVPLCHQVTAAHSNILAWRIPWTEEPDGYSPWSCKEIWLKQVSTHIFVPTPHHFLLDLCCAIRQRNSSRSSSLKNQNSEKWKCPSNRVRLFATPWTIQSVEFSRPEDWSG